jgi:hypothetical protein
MIGTACRSVVDFERKKGKEIDKRTERNMTKNGKHVPVFATKAYEREDVQLHAFLETERLGTTAVILNPGIQRLSPVRPGCFVPGKTAPCKH